MHSGTPSAVAVLATPTRHCDGRRFIFPRFGTGPRAGVRFRGRHQRGEASPMTAHRSTAGLTRLSWGMTSRCGYLSPDSVKCSSMVSRHSFPSVAMLKGAGHSGSRARLEHSTSSKAHIAKGSQKKSGTPFWLTGISSDVQSPPTSARVRVSPGSTPVVVYPHHARPGGRADSAVYRGWHTKDGYSYPGNNGRVDCGRWCGKVASMREHASEMPCAECGDVGASVSCGN